VSTESANVGKNDSIIGAAVGDLRRAGCVP
jgi:hypothetical protein